MELAKVMKASYAEASWNENWTDEKAELALDSVNVMYKSF